MSREQQQAKRIAHVMEYLESDGKILYTTEKYYKKEKISEIVKELHFNTFDTTRNF